MKSRNSPLVSIIMSVYNTADFLPFSIESILHQTFRDFEFIIINDGSTDRSGEIIERYAKLDHRIRVVHKENTGISDSLNLAAKISRGKFLARQDPDDISLPSRLKKQINYLYVNKNVDVLGTSNFIIDSQGKIIKRWFRPTKFKEIKFYLPCFNPMCHGSVVIKKKVFFDVGMYNPAFDKAEDYELWFRLINYGKILENLPDFLYLWRTHCSSVSGSQIKRQLEIVQQIFSLYQIPYERFESLFYKKKFFYEIKYLIKGYIEYFLLRFFFNKLRKGI